MLRPPASTPRRKTTRPRPSRRRVPSARSRQSGGEGTVSVQVCGSSLPLETHADTGVAAASPSSQGARGARERAGACVTDAELSVHDRPPRVTLCGDMANEALVSTVKSIVANARAGKLDEGVLRLQRALRLRGLPRVHPSRTTSGRRSSSWSTPRACPIRCRPSPSRPIAPRSGRWSISWRSTGSRGTTRCSACATSPSGTRRAQGSSSGRGLPSSGSATPRAIQCGALMTRVSML